MDLYTFIGTLGAFLILIAFILLQNKKWQEDYLIYDFTNFLGSALLVTYAVLLESLPFLILNGIWSAVSLRDCMIDLKKNSQKTETNFWTKWLY